MTSIKITFQDETRRVLLRENGESLNYSKLINTLLNLFPILCGKTFQLTWQDDDGDIVTCSSDAELEDAIYVMSSQSKTLKFGVKLQSDHNTTSATGGVPRSIVHPSVTCDECGVSPIVGIRYKCAVRRDFDLCEGCEAKKLQPYPMIKIVDPSQAPEILVFGLRDGQRNEEGLGGGGFGGRHWHRGFRHGHHGPPPPCAAEATAAGGNPNPAAGGPGGYGGGPGPWARRGGPGGRCSWGKKFEKFTSDIAKDPAVAPFIQAVDNFVNQFTGEDNQSNTTAPAQAHAESVKPPTTATANSNSQAASTAGKPSEEQQLEEQLLEQAILESLTINNEEAAAAAAAAGTTAVPPPPPPVNYVETARPAVPTLPKPALRFVRDVTFPDGTSVQPGAVFRKTWRVRNDGNHAWPEGTSLVSVGGDLLSDQNHREALPILQPDQEAEIALQLTAPHLPGMYTAYYRAQTKEQQYFGQRLWAAIVVTDQNDPNDWQVVNDQLKTATPSPLVVPPAAAVPSGAVPSVMEEKKSPTEALVGQDTAAVPSAPSVPGAASAPLTSAETAAAAAPPAHLRSAILLWRRELAILNDMGFEDPEVVIPLLQQHFSSPLSLSADKNAVPNVEGMQQVVAALLNQQQQEH